MRAACSSCIQGRTEVVCYSKADKSIRRSSLGLPWFRSANLVHIRFCTRRSGSQTSLGKVWLGKFGFAKFHVRSCPRVEMRLSGTSFLSLGRCPLLCLNACAM